MSPDEPVHQPLVEPDGLLRGIERDGEVLSEVLSPGRAEVVAGAADGDDEGVVRKGAWRRAFVALRIDTGREMDFVLRSVEADHFSDTGAEVAVRSLGQVVDRIAARIQAAGRDLVEKRLSDVGSRTLDEGDLGLFPPPEAASQLRCKFQACGPAFDNDDVVQRGRGDLDPGRSVAGRRAWGRKRLRGWFDDGGHGIPSYAAASDGPMSW